VVGKKKKKKRKKLEARVAKWLAFWQTATRLPVILKKDNPAPSSLIQIGQVVNHFSFSSHLVVDYSPNWTVGNSFSLH
jgi:hypothetical protein